MTANKLFKRIALIGVSTIALAVSLGYAISVYLGTATLGINDALAFFLQAGIVIVPVVLFLGALPVAISVIALSKKKKHAPTNSGE